MPTATRKTEETKTVHADERGRITLGAKAGRKDYRVRETAHGEIVLTPVVHVPERERWLWQNPEALAAVRAGLAQATAGEVHDLGSFAAFAGEEAGD